MPHSGKLLPADEDRKENEDFEGTLKVVSSFLSRIPGGGDEKG